MYGNVTHAGLYFPIIWVFCWVNACLLFLRLITPQRASFVPDTLLPPSHNWNACGSWHFIGKKIREIDVRTIIHIRTRTVVFCFLYFEEKEKSPLLRHSIGSVHLFHPYQRNCVFHFVRFYQLLFARLSVVSGHSYFHSLSLSALSFSLSLSLFSLSFSCSLFWIIGFFTIQSIICIIFWATCYRLPPKQMEKKNNNSPSVFNIAKRKWRNFRRLFCSSIILSLLYPIVVMVSITQNIPRENPPLFALVCTNYDKKNLSPHYSCRHICSLLSLFIAETYVSPTPSSNHCKVMYKTRITTFYFFSTDTQTDAHDRDTTLYPSLPHTHTHTHNTHFTLFPSLYQNPSINLSITFFGHRDVCTVHLVSNFIFFSLSILPSSIAVITTNATLWENKITPYFNLFFKLAGKGHKLVALKKGQQSSQKRTAEMRMAASNIVMNTKLINPTATL